MKSISLFVVVVVVIPPFRFVVVVWLEHVSESFLEGRSFEAVGN